MTSEPDMSVVLHILRSLYGHVRTLEEFSDSLVFREGNRAVLVEESDTSRYKSFVKGVYVCFDKELQHVPSFAQICTFLELLAFVLNTMKRKKKRNVLAHGYRVQGVAQENRNADYFKFQGGATQSAAFLHGSDLWKRVALRLGTDITRYLLESCSVFMAVPPSCAFQLCGVPVYDRVSVSTASSKFHLHPQVRRHSWSQFGRQHKSNLKKRRVIMKPERSRIRMKRGEKVNKQKRKRELDQPEEEETVTSKRRRVMKQTDKQEVKQTCSETEEERRTTSVESTLPKKNAENSVTAFKQPAKTSSILTSGGPSWRSGTFPPLPPSQCFIRTLGFLYGGRGMRSFLLNRKKRTVDGARWLQGKDLIRMIFFEGLMYLNGLERKPKKLPWRFFNMVPLFNQLLLQHRKCPYDKILHKMCPLVEESDAVQAEIKSLLPKHCASHRVYLFVRECLSAVIPQELWGSDHNRLCFLTRVRGFLRSGKYERMSVAELMWKVKVNDCDWLKISKTGRIPPSELAYRTKVLGQFLTWLLDGYVVSLVRACFYATESMGQKNAIRFYRQQMWAKLQDLAFRDHLAKGQLEELSPAQVASLPKGTVVSRLRFIPKTVNMRPITRVVGTDPKTRVYQARVRDLQDTLQACVRSTPALLGSTVWGMTDIHRVLCSVAPAQKNNPHYLYFAKVDVSGAYESLPHDKLMEVINEVISPIKDEFLKVSYYTKIWMDFHEGLKKTFVRQSDLFKDSCKSTNMKGFLMSLQKSGKVHNSIFVEQHFSIRHYGRHALQFLTQMLTDRVVKYKKKTYRQCRGIPQGAVVSSLLCCLCYGHMENVLFRDITENKGCLMRLVDDFLLITPDPHQAHTFLKVLLAGVPQYGLVVNPQKVVVNFQIPGSVGTCPGIRMLSPHCLFPWCGLLLDTRSLDVYKDYSSYAGLSLRYSLTLGFYMSAGQQMKRKLMAILRLKCHTLFLDLKNNCLEAVYQNIYKLVLLQACRFHVCAQCLPFGQTVAKNPVYFVQMIWDMAQYTNKLIRSSNKGLTLGSKAQTGLVQYEAVELIFCLTFLLVLSKHRTLYKDLLPQLHKRKRNLERRLGDLRLARVRQASNPRTPEDFLPIQV